MPSRSGPATWVGRNVRHRLWKVLFASYAVLLTLFGAASGATGAAAAYVHAPAAPLAAAAGSPLASVAVATELTLVSEEAGGYRVLLHGWANEAAPDVLYFAAGRRIALARLSDAGVPARVVLEEVVDAFQNRWQFVRIEGIVPAHDVHPDRTQLWAAGAALLAANCGSCHNAPTPGQFTVNQWPGTLQSMVPSNVSLTPEDLELLTKFLQYHASDM